MPNKYNHKEIDKKWQKKWEEEKLYKTQENKSKPKFYCLDMFPYPSGAGLHVGHPKGYIATDVVARMKMMQGHNVLHPMGWDAFGLPTENYAIKNKIHPRIATEENIKKFKSQLEKIGFTYDWSREINTTDPEFYRWTQLVFLEMFKRGLAYESYEPINWCPSCKTGLANEDLEGGKCERCGSEIERKPMRQWVLKITEYADRLLEDLDKLPEWEESIKEMQRNWIGKSEGALVKFKIKTAKQNERIEDELEVFTTRPDTLFGCTYVVIAPEHSLIEQLKDKIENYEEVEKYIEQAKKKSDLERTDLAKGKTGVKIEGLVVVNPVNNEEVPIFVADYVLAGYGTGAIMAVPAHDERDFEFAVKYGLPIKQVVIKNQNDNTKYKDNIECFTGDGINVNSGFLDNLPTQKAKKKIIEWLEEHGVGKRAVNYKLQDWVFSRQRYWGEPIPVIHCENCKNRKYNFILLHGFGGNAESNFFPWLKEKLEKDGHSVFVPNLPNTNNPNISEQVDYVLANTKIDENTIIIGHSLGGVVAIRLLEKANKKVAKVMFVDSFIKPEFTDIARPEIENSQNWDMDFNKIKLLADEFIVLADRDFSVIPREQSLEMAKIFDARLAILKPNDWHFCGQEEPDVLRLLGLDGIHPVPEKELPVTLPDVESYEPTGTGESPLANIKDWVNTICPKCGAPARRETNTMPQWAGSSWYYLRYIDPHNDKALVDKEKEKYWSPVDLYVGGAEHATRHLIYARFWHKFLYDIGVVNYPEPFKRLQHVGLIMAEDGRKMSKRWGNVINPDDIVEKYGADTLRVYEMFMGPFNQSVAWNTKGLIGIRRFLDKVWVLKDKIKNTESEIRNNKIIGLLHKTIKKVTEDIENFKFNTAIAQMMILVNKMNEENEINKEDYEIFLKLLAPFAPHLTEELWHQLGNKESIFRQRWPEYNQEFIKDKTITLVVQVNGKVRDNIEVSADITEKEARELAISSEKVKKWINDREIVKVIFVKGKLVNIVVK